MGLNAAYSFTVPDAARQPPGDDAFCSEAGAAEPEKKGRECCSCTASTSRLCAEKIKLRAEKHGSLGLFPMPDKLRSTIRNWECEPKVFIRGAAIDRSGQQSSCSGPRHSARRLRAGAALPHCGGLPAGSARRTVYWVEIRVQGDTHSTHTT
jgi:hypothetical protein